MPERPRNPFSTGSRACQWVNLQQALHHFAIYIGPTQSQQHIKPLHWYVACRLVLEGGFHPDNITPRPPFAVVTRCGDSVLEYAPNLATGSERTILGGLKTKNVDVVVTKEGIGPVMAVSCKGMTGAFRNLTNRMEETIGECTNLHITYPAMVFGYLFVIRANRAAEVVAELAEDERVPARALAANDIAVQRGGEPVESILRFHAALRELTGRRGIRNDGSRYESVALALIETVGTDAGTILAGFPPQDSPLRLEQFFQTLYLRYEERYLYGAPELKAITQRLAWSPASPAFSYHESGAHAFPVLDYALRLASYGDTPSSPSGRLGSG
jgi:hypothetical protein